MVLLVLIVFVVLELEVEVHLLSDEGLLLRQINPEVFFQLSPDRSKGYGSQISSLQNFHDPLYDLFISDYHHPSSCWRFFSFFRLVLSASSPSSTAFAKAGEGSPTYVWTEEGIRVSAQDFDISCCCWNKGFCAGKTHTEKKKT